MAVAAAQIDAPTIRICCRCGLAKPLEAFYRSRRDPLGRVYDCKACRSAWAAARYAASRDARRAKAKTWRDANRDSLRARGRASYRANREKIATRNRGRRDAFRAIDLKRMFGLSPEDYARLHEQQGGVCAACGEPEICVSRRSGRTLRLAVDHDRRCCPGERSCGRCIRGLLCARCNTTLGRYHEDVGLLMRLIDYVRRRTS